MCDTLLKARQCIGRDTLHCIADDPPSSDALQWPKTPLICFWNILMGRRSVPDTEEMAFGLDPVSVESYSSILHGRLI